MNNNCTNAPPTSQKKGETNKEINNLKNIIFEVIILGGLVNLMVSFFTGGISDVFGVCGFTEQVCSALRLQGVMYLLLAFVFAVFSVVVGFVLSKEFKKDS
jgi:hypothetical protein